jgi:hypothetical protein
VEPTAVIDVAGRDPKRRLVGHCSRQVPTHQIRPTQKRVRGNTAAGERLLLSFMGICPNGPRSHHRGPPTYSQSYVHVTHLPVLQ